MVAGPKINFVVGGGVSCCGGGCFILPEDHGFMLIYWRST